MCLLCARRASALDSGRLRPTAGWPDARAGRVVQRKRVTALHQVLANRGRQACRLAIELELAANLAVPIFLRRRAELFRVTAQSVFHDERLRLLVAEGAIRCDRREPSCWHGRGSRLTADTSLTGQTKPIGLFATDKRDAEQAAVIGDDFASDLAA